MHIKSCFLETSSDFLLFLQSKEVLGHFLADCPNSSRQESLEEGIPELLQRCQHTHSVQCIVPWQHNLHNQQSFLSTTRGQGKAATCPSPAFSPGLWSLKASYAVLQSLHVYFSATSVNPPGIKVPESVHLSSPSFLQREYMHSHAKLQLEWSHLMFMQDHTSFLPDIFHILPSIALFSLSFSEWNFLVYYYKILFWSLHCFNFLLLVSLGWTKSCNGVELSFIESSWININTGNHQNHGELISWEILS